MKQGTILLVFLLSLVQTDCQDVVHKILDANNIQAALQSDGTLFRTDDQYGYFMSPNEGGSGPASTATIGNLWLSGQDQFGNLYTAYGLYGNGFHSYTHGMLDSIGNLSQEPLMSQNRVWKISRKDIIEHLFNFNAGTLEQISVDILEWPARGNPEYGGLLDDRNCAPFIDFNLDGRYNPKDGDYPHIDFLPTEKVPDQLLLSVSNANPFDWSTNFRAEIYTMLYAFECDDDEAINRSIFQKQIIFNRSGLTYQDLRFGHFFDLGVGCYGDDYIGCDTSQNAFYTYNKDFDDGIDFNCPNDIELFVDPPVHVVKVLNKKMERFMQSYNGMFESTFNNGLFIDYIQDVYFLLGGIWQDGTPLTYGGNGYNPKSTDTTYYVFPGNPNDPDSWSMYNEQVGRIDPRVWVSYFIDSLARGESVTLELSHTVAQSELYDFKETIDFALSESAKLEEFYNSRFSSPCNQSSTSKVDDYDLANAIKIYPNPNQGYFAIDSEIGIDSYQIFDISGDLLQSGVLSKQSHITTMLKDGIYFIRLKANDNKVINKKLLITN